MVTDFEQAHVESSKPLESSMDDTSVAAASDAPSSGDTSVAATTDRSGAVAGDNSEVVAAADTSVHVAVDTSGAVADDTPVAIAVGIDTSEAVASDTTGANVDDSSGAVAAADTSATEDGKISGAIAGDTPVAVPVDTSAAVVSSASGAAASNTSADVSANTVAVSANTVAAAVSDTPAAVTGDTSAAVANNDLAAIANDTCVAVFYDTLLAVPGDAFVALTSDTSLVVDNGPSTAVAHDPSAAVPDDTSLAIPEDTSIAIAGDISEGVADATPLNVEEDPGPIDVSVLYNQEEHISSAIWEGQERGVLRIYEHTTRLEKWKLLPKQVELVEKAGFKYFRRIGEFTLDKALISALIERWRKETNTFHLTVGEMTITLDEVALILGLPIDGDPIPKKEVKSTIFAAEKYLGKRPTGDGWRGGFLKLHWLEKTFAECPEDATDEQVEQYTRAYLAYLLGSTIFATSSGNTVPAMCLPLLEDFDKAGKYAWGAAALAGLYKSLGKGTSKYQSTISGCLTLLQCWSYFHLDVGRPNLNQDSSLNSFPLALLWKHTQGAHRAKQDMVQYRRELDSLEASQVEWMPYRNLHIDIPEELKGSLILGRSRTSLICLDKIEKHFPERCLRQFGMRQTIPPTVSLKNDVESSLEEWKKRQYLVVGDEVTNDSFSIDDDSLTEYMKWYFRITRKFIGRRVSTDSRFQQTVDSVRKMLELVDSLKYREDMVPTNKELIENIRSALVNSLKNPDDALILMNAEENDVAPRSSRKRPRKAVTPRSSKRRKQK